MKGVDRLFRTAGGLFKHSSVVPCDIDTPQARKLFFERMIAKYWMIWIFDKQLQCIEKRFEYILRGIPELCIKGVEKFNVWNVFVFSYHQSENEYTQVPIVLKQST